MPYSVTLQELAVALHVCERTIDRRIDRGELPKPDLVFHGGKVWYMPTLDQVNIRPELFPENSA